MRIRRRKPAPPPELPKLEAPPKGSELEPRLSRLEKNERHIVERTAQVFTDFNRRIAAVEKPKAATKLSGRVTARDREDRIKEVVIAGHRVTVTSRDEDGRLSTFEIHPEN